MCWIFSISVSPPGILNRWENRFCFSRYSLTGFLSLIFFTLVIGIIDGFQFFTQAYVTSANTFGDRTTPSLGSPQGSLLFYAVYLYQQGFSYFRMGYASALAWVLFVITMICTVLVIRSSRHWVHYQGEAIA